MSNLFRKAAEEYKVNGKMLHIRPLPVGLVLRLKTIRKPVAEAIAKLKAVGVNDFEEVTHTNPKPTKEDPESIEYIKKTSHKAPSSEAVEQTVNNRTEGIEALFNCFLEEKLIAEILIGSVEELKGITPEQLFDPVGDQSIDIAVAAEIFGCIVEVNKKGFERLGKYWHPLKSMIESVQTKK